KVIWFGTKIGADAAHRAVEAVDFVAAIATVLPNQVIAVGDFRCRCVGEFLARLELDNVVVTLQTGGFGKPPRIHRINPVRIVKPSVFLVPAVHLQRGARSVRGPFEGGGAALAVVANGAGKGLHLVRAGIAEIKVEPRMRDIGIGHAAADFEVNRLSAFGEVLQPASDFYWATIGTARGNRIAVDFGDHVAEHQARKLRIKVLAFAGRGDELSDLLAEFQAGGLLDRDTRIVDASLS